jgi:hypothetical protein
MLKDFYLLYAAEKQWCVPTRRESFFFSKKNQRNRIKLHTAMYASEILKNEKTPPQVVETHAHSYNHSP